IVLFGTAASLAAAQQPESRPPLPTAEVDAPVDPGKWMDSVRAAYRGTLIHERHTITVTPPGDEPAASAVVITRTVPSESGPRTLIRFGPFDALLEPGRVAVVHRHNDKIVFISLGGEGLDPLLNAAPSIPLPQLALIHSTGQRAGAELTELGRLGPWFGGLTVEQVTIGADGLASSAVGTSDGGKPRVVLQADESRRFTSFSARVRATEPGGAWGQIRIDSVEIDKVPVPEWDELVAGREPVESLSLLRAAPSPVSVGDVLPGLGLMTRSLDAWGFADQLAAGQRAAPGSLQMFAVVLFDAADAEAVSEGASGCRAVQRAEQRMRRENAVAQTQLPHFNLVPVGVVPVDDFRRDVLTQRQTRWAQTVGDRGPADAVSNQVWSSSGPKTIGRFVPGSSAAVLIADASLRLVAILPLDGRAGDEDALAGEIWLALTSE
ncbi:MAG: hypothetical protein ACOYN0_15500, partial [Phycisphaerales bacterium]